MQATLMARKVWKVVKTDVADAEEETSQAIGIISLHLSPAIRSAFRDYESAALLWKAIEGRYAQRSSVRRTTLKQQLHSTKMTQTESVDEYIARIRNITTELETTGYSTQDTDVVDTVLAGLTEAFEMTKVAITATNSDLKLADVEAALLDREQQLRSQSDRETTAVDAAYWSQSRRQPIRSNIVCYNCNKRGHIASECRSGSNGAETFSSVGAQGSQRSQSGQRDNRSYGGRNNNRGRGRGRVSYHNRGRGNRNQSDSNAMAFVTNDRSTSQPSNNNGVPWILDPASTNHICSDRELFQDLREHDDLGFVTTGGGSQVAVKGSGSVIITAGDKKLILQDTYYAPQFGCNLLSTNQATEVAPVRFLFKKDGCDLLRQDPEDEDKWEEWLHVPKHATQRMSILYSGQPDNPHHRLSVPQRRPRQNRPESKSGNSQPKAFLTKAPESPEIWHLRYGHLSYDGLASLMRHDMIVGINVKPLEFSAKSKDACDSCIMSKLHRMPFSTSTQSTTSPLELIHMDLCGPMPTRSLGGGWYFATILDDYSGLSVVRVLKTKDEVKSFIIDTFTMLENQIDSTVKRVRTDNGREYVNHTLQAFYKHKGIHVETTVPYTPEQNGKAERLNRTLTERERSMRFESQLPDRLWAESIMTANYLRNRSPRKGQDVTPYEAFYETKPDVSHMKVFGSVAYAHVPKQHRNKLGARAVKGVFVGYCSDKKAYRLYIDERVIISRDIVFDEHSMLTAHTLKVSTNDNTDIIQTDEDDIADTIINDAGDMKAAADNQSIISDKRRTDTAVIPDIDSAGVLGSHDYSGRSARDPEMRDDGSIVQNKQTIQAFTAKAKQYTDPISDDPTSYAEAMNAADSQKWQQAMQAEIDSLVSHDVWTTTCPMPGNVHALPVKWVYKKKYDARGMPDRYKARLVVKGYEQEYGINYSEVFSPTSRSSTLRTFLAHVAQNKLHLHSMDVVTAFLQGGLDEQVYIEAPPGFNFEGDHRTAKLHKALYGLKQAPRAFYKHMKRELEKLGFAASVADPALFIKCTESGTVLILTYVDDFQIAAESLQMIESVKRQLHDAFEIRDLGETNEFLNMTVEYEREAGTLRVAQQAAILKAVQSFGLANSKGKALPMSTSDVVTAQGELLPQGNEYRSIVGSLLYFSITTRPDISFSVGVLSRHMAAPTVEHLKLAKNVLRYLSETSDLGLEYQSVNGDATFTGYSDADYAGDRDTRRSTTGYVFTYNGTAISWNSKRQSSTAMSTMEAEYYAASLASKEAIWLQVLLSELTQTNKFNSPVLHIDNQSAIRLIEEPVVSQRSKHIDVAYHFIREKVAENRLKIKYLQTDRMVADSLTKAVPVDKFTWCRGHMNLV